jgi:hypothetical protein
MEVGLLVKMLAYCSIAEVQAGFEAISIFN